MPDNKELPEENFISANKEIDVSAIMDSIKQKIAEKKKSGVLKQTEIDEIMDMELLPLPDFLEIPNVYEPHLYPEHKHDGFHAFHVEPEIETGLAKKILGKIRKLLAPLTRFMIRPYLSEMKNLTALLHNQNKEDIHNLKQTVPITFQSKEYIKLLHNTINNTIVELSKLKIDHDLLKTRIKVLEDKIEFLENRERAIEKKIFEKSKKE
ncbi:MAG: hypothetical protein KAW12_08755 [Candidatus Aminicenantes bacterium]|nr:hypothetical protein [Candidatus Aminicenantes bacterium]